MYEVNVWSWWSVGCGGGKISSCFSVLFAVPVFCAWAPLERQTSRLKGFLLIGYWSHDRVRPCWTLPAAGSPREEASLWHAQTFAQQIQSICACAAQESMAFDFAAKQQQKIKPLDCATRFRVSQSVVWVISTVYSDTSSANSRKPREFGSHRPNARHANTTCWPG